MLKMPFPDGKQEQSGKKPNMNESHVRRARLHLDKKKKKFEQQPYKQGSQGSLS